MIVPICALIGLILGLVVGVLGSQRVYATALVDAGPGNSPQSALEVSQDVASTYVQTELVHIDILEPQIDAATQAAGLSGSSAIKARQVGGTPLVEITAQATSPDAAARKANTAAGVYIDDWRARANEDLQTQKQNTAQRITAIKTSIANLGTSPTDKAQAAGLRSQLERLSTEESDLEFREGEVQSADRMVQMATPDTATPSTNIVVDAALGLVIGLVIGVAIITYRRRTGSGAAEQEML